MKKIIVAGILYFFLIPAVFSRNGEYVGGASFIKRIEYNLIMLDEVYNLRSKGDVEKLFFGDFNAPVEFFYKPSFSGASGFRIVKSSLDNSCILEIKYISNYKEALKEADKNRRQIDVPERLLESLPKELLHLLRDYNSNGAMAKRFYEEQTKRFKVESRSFPVSDRFAELLYNKMVSFIDNFKGKGVPPTVADGYSVTFRTVVEDEVWSLAIHMPNGEALKMADMYRQIMTDAEKNEWDESKYILLLDKHREEEMNVPASESRTNVEPINKRQSGRGIFRKTELRKTSCLREGVRMNCFFLYALRERQGRTETVEANTAR